MNMKFNKKEYNRNYMKERRKEMKQFRVDLKSTELDELDFLLKKSNITRSQFLKNAISNFKQRQK